MSPQTIARVFGVLYLITFFTSIPAFFVFYAPVLDDLRYIVGAGADNSVALGALLELILIIANIGTAVVLFPILKRQNEILILGYVTARVIECVFIAVGLLSGPIRKFFDARYGHAAAEEEDKSGWCSARRERSRSRSWRVNFQANGLATCS